VNTYDKEKEAERVREGSEKTKKEKT